MIITIKPHISLCCSIDHQRMSLAMPPPSLPLSQHLNNTQFGGTYTPLTKSMLGHGVNDLSEKLRQDLDRSINRHLEKGQLHAQIQAAPLVAWPPLSVGLFYSFFLLFYFIIFLLFLFIYYQSFYYLFRAFTVCSTQIRAGYWNVKYLSDVSLKYWSSFFF